MTRETIVQGVRAWLLEAMGLDPEDVDDAGKVIPADDPGPRPDLPYVVVEVASIRTVGVRESRELTAGTATRGERSIIVALTGCGDGAGDWLADLELAPRDGLDAAGLAFVSAGPLRRIPGVRDTVIEARDVVEVTLAASFARDPVATLECDVVSITVEHERYPDAPDSLTDTFTITEG